MAIFQFLSICNEKYRRAIVAWECPVSVAKAQDLRWVLNAVVEYQSFHLNLDIGVYTELPGCGVVLLPTHSSTQTT